MGVYFTMTVIPLDAQGEVVLEALNEPNFSRHSSDVSELFDRTGKFAEALNDLPLAWYHDTTMSRCLAGRRNPVRSDCYDAADILTDVLEIRRRLRDGGSAVPRHYRIRPHWPGAAWTDRMDVFYGGRFLRIGAGLNYCRASSPVEAPPGCNEAMYLLTHDPDISIDLRGQDRFKCQYAESTPDGARPGGSLTLAIDSRTPDVLFAPILDEMEAFCRKVDPAKFAVFTLFA
jgi:hypothetical protein